MSLNIHKKLLHFDHSQKVIGYFIVVGVVSFERGVVVSLDLLGAASAPLEHLREPQILTESIIACTKQNKHQT